MRCPTCRAPWREQRECARCGSDLTSLMRIAAAAWRQRAAAIEALAAGAWPNVQRHASEADRLQRTEHGTTLLWIARLMNRSTG